MGARIAANANSTTIAPPAIATRSRRSRRHAIWAGERPRIAVVSGLASVGSGAVEADSGETGTVTKAPPTSKRSHSGQGARCALLRAAALFLPGRIGHEHTLRQTHQQV